MKRKSNVRMLFSFMLFSNRNEINNQMNNEDPKDTMCDWLRNLFKNSIGISLVEKPKEESVRENHHQRFIRFLVYFLPT